MYVTGHHYPFIFKRLFLYVSVMYNNGPVIIIMLTFGELQHCRQDMRQYGNFMLSVQEAQ